MGKSKESVRDLAESVLNDVPASYYTHAIKKLQRLRRDIRALIDEECLHANGTRVMHNTADGSCMFPESEYPEGMWSGLKSLEVLADSLDRRHGAALKSFVISGLSELGRCLHAGDVPESELQISLNDIRTGCKHITDTLLQKVESLRAPLPKHGITREQAISIVTGDYDKLPPCSRKDAMSQLVEANREAASFLLQEDWAKLLGVSVRTISKYTAWQQLKEFKKSTRMSLKSPRSLADYDLTPDDGDDDE